MKIEMKFEACKTLEDVRDLQHIEKEKINAAAKARRAEINEALNKVTRAEIKRWKRGQVVYFGSPETLLFLRGKKATSTCNKAKVHSVIGGKNARVWLVVPKGHGTHSGDDYGFPGKDLRVYRLREIRRHEISRVELSIRKKAGAK
jgi:hypothetical protein